MKKITWNHECLFCKRLISRGKPTLIFSTEEPKLVGLSHSTCCATKYRYGCYQMCPPYYLSGQQLSFLIQFYPRLYRLPGGMEPNRELRVALAQLLHDYPSSLADPIACLNRFLDEQEQWYDEWSYSGDLEKDFLRFLGKTQRAAKEPLGLEVDFSQ
jgi:hypothetical protein